MSSPPVPPPPAPPSMANLKEMGKFTPKGMQATPIGPPKTFSEQVYASLSQAGLLDSRLEKPDQDPENARGLCLVCCPSKHSRGILQDGPQCGLVALAMAFDILTGSNAISVATCMEQARFQGFSANGEMFSVANMVTLAQSINPDIKSTEESIETLRDPQTQGLSWLRGEQPAVFLVPYDSDFNQRPCLKKGHRAHWCLVLGCVLVTPSHVPHSIDIRQWTQLKTKPDEAQVYVQPSDAQPVPDCWKSLATLGHPIGFYYLVRQGKSLRLFLFSPKDLCESNADLKEWKPSEGDERSFILPDGGIAQGLAGK
eukprot:maker-scaffold496_size155344-snap-gene-0.24 protein:Tk03359 transcript:maker-scaffold496_size155344-snap-gene-0.24-mRNA-1 annotation:"upf0692 protein c19orf54 homolog isoform x1"